MEGRSSVEAGERYRIPGSQRLLRIPRIRPKTHSSLSRREVTVHTLRTLRWAARVFLISPGILLLALALLPEVATAESQARGNRSAPPAQPAQPAAAADTLHAPTWVLVRDKPTEGDLVEAWLVVPRYRIGDTTATVTVLPPSSARVWLRPAKSSCADAERDASLTARGAVPRDTIFFACVRLTGEGSVRLVAVRRALDATGTAILQRIAVSDPIVASAWFIDPTVAGIIGAVVGLLAGVLGHMLRGWWDRRTADRKSVKEMQKIIADALVPEVTENTRRLEAWLPAGGTKGPDLEVARYNQVLADKGIVAFLDESTRNSYWPKVKSLYVEVQAYTDINEDPGKQAAEKIDAGKAVLKRLKAPLT